MSIEIYRALYRALIAEAVQAGVVADAADFNDRALLAIGKDTIAAAREGNEDAICDVCDAAEIWLDSVLADIEWADFGDPSGVHERAWHRDVWNRACDHLLDTQYTY